MVVFQKDDLGAFAKAFSVTMLVVIPFMGLIAYLNMVVRLDMPFNLDVFIGPLLMGTLVSFIISTLNLKYYLKLARIEQEKKCKLEQLVAERTRELEEASDKLRRLSVTDCLTGLANRRGFEECVTKEVAILKRGGGSLSLLMIDIDQFKPYNDNYGHEQGDITLKAVARTINESLPRTTDTAIRFGGEEFIALLPATDAQGALIVANEIIGNLAKKNIEHKFSNVANYITVSIGIATMAGEEIDDKVLLKNADDALYESKANGRNRVKLYR